ncbi:hypothetical protein [Ferrovibrio terrae]|uniref:hypothetical protein n=1 Tax=Ferrovibrio terrae TaxID=2594003 RepID=UPI003138268E
MRIELPIRFTVRAPENASKYIPSIIARISADFENEKRGHVQRYPSEFLFRRRVAALPFSYDELALFDDGKFSITAQGHVLIVDCKLGMKIGERMALFLLGIFVLALVSRNEPFLFLTIVGLVIIATSVFAFLRLLAVRRWLNKIVQNTITLEPTAR